MLVLSRLINHNKSLWPMSIGYFKFVLSLLILADNLQFDDPCFTDMLDIDY